MQTKMIITDHVSESGNAIASVRPSVRLSVSTLTFEPRDLFDLTFCMCVSHDQLTIALLGLKVRGQGQRSKCVRWDPERGHSFSEVFEGIQYYIVA